MDVGGYLGGTARFAHQILTTAMSAGGDSGSLLSNLEEAAVGLLFAGSAAVTVVNHLHVVQALLGVRIHREAASVTAAPVAGSPAPAGQEVCGGRATRRGVRARQAQRS